VTLTVVCAAFAAALEIWTPTPTQSVHALSAAAADSVMRPPESRSTARHAPLPTAAALLISSCQDSAVRRAAAANSAPANSPPRHARYATPRAAAESCAGVSKKSTERRRGGECGGDLLWSVLANETTAFVFAPLPLLSR
jgi:hypothetical protein